MSRRLGVVSRWYALIAPLVVVGGCSERGADLTVDARACAPGVHDVAVLEDAPFGLLAEGNYVYWTTAVLDGPKRVRRAAVDADAVETVAETTGEIAALAVDDDGTVYWPEVAAGGAAGAVMVARPGQAPEMLYPVTQGLDVFAIAIDDATVYWLANRPSGAGFVQTVYRAPKSGGVPTVLGSLSLAATTQSRGMIIDGGTTFWSDGLGGVHALTSPGETVTLLDEPDGVAAFVVESGVVYAIARDAATSVVSADLTTRARRVISTGTGARWALAASGERLYASTADDRIVSFPKDGGEAMVALDIGVRSAGGLAVVGDRLYWANTATAAAGGAVRWMCRTADEQ